MPPEIHTLLPKDSISTAGGLYFAVLLPSVAGQPVYCSLRYVHTPPDPPHKLDTKQAYDLLRKNHPNFLGYSETLDAETVRVPDNEIMEVYKPREALQRIERDGGEDELKRTAVTAADILRRHGVRHESLGITGSLLLDFHNTESDIDIVVYDMADFHRTREIIGDLQATGEIDALDEAAWLETYRRRDCALDFETYLRHEKRKYNKFKIGRTKIDVSYVPVKDPPIQAAGPVEKLGSRRVRARVLDDTQAFSYPACYIIDDKKFTEIRCYTATYIGQAFKDESIEAVGMLERDAEGRLYMVIGTSREAPGEYLKVIE